MTESFTDFKAVSLSVVDEERFGVRTAKAFPITKEKLPQVLEFCEEHKVVFLMARCFAEDLSTVHALEGEGFRLMDTLCYWRLDLTAPSFSFPLNPLIKIRPVQINEAEKIKALARRAFHGYLSHYHTDQRLDPALCDEVYADWAYRSCLSHEVAQQVLVAEWEGQVAGFATVRLNNVEEGEGLLSGVDPDLRNTGIHKALLVARAEWCKNQGTAKMIQSTQITNLIALKNWQALGFEPQSHHYTFHKWFDE